MKKILFIGGVLLTVFVIYLCNMDKKVYYVVLGEDVDRYSSFVKNYLKDRDVLERYLDDFSSSSVRISDIINDINDNKKLDDGTTFKNALIKADLVTLSINVDDVYSREDDVYDYIDELALCLDDLLKLMREYCKEDIVFVGYSGDKVINYLNKKFKEVCLNYGVSYVDGTKMIGNKVVQKVSDKLFND